jgi:hypothetical protein
MSIADLDYKKMTAALFGRAPPITAGAGIIAE